VKSHPTDYELKQRYGKVLMQARRLDDAIKQFQNAVKDPKLKIPALNCIGTCFKEKGLYDLAETQYQQALDAVADQDSDIGKELKYNLGVVCEKKGNKDGALGWYQKIMAIDIGYRDVSARVTALMNGGSQG
jgi:tetratricopeptide (TPR) repeat protein